MQKIMFNDRYGLTQAVIEGRKTMTRRLVPWDFTEQWMEFVSDAPSVGGVYVHESEKDFYEREAPRYTVGEIVAVAQNYSSFYNILDNTRPIPEGAGWDNKMFVRADLMPHRIRITGIKCERLQDIQDADCLKEGVRYIPKINKFYFEGVRREAGFYFDDHREAFTMLIDKVSGRGTWASNPWVVVYEFELVK
ncbi:MAG: hypothetical protein ACLUGU_04345 [Alistipes shahii]